VDDDELHALIEELETALRDDARTALAQTAQDFATAVDNADELVAAAFGVSRIGAMWRRRVGGLVESLRRIARRGAVVAAEDLEEPVPSKTDTSAFLDPYFDQVRTQLDAVGDRLSERAVTSLREGIELGETQDELKQRMLAVFSEDGTQLGDGRANRIAMTSATSAFNAGVLAAAQAITGPDRPLVKQWVARRDTKVREAHHDANGQLQLLDDPFDVAGVPMQFPGDPTAPIGLLANCRCVMRVSAADRTAAASGPEETPMDTVTAAGDGEHTGAMIALVPSEADAARLALDGDGAEPVEELHLTLAYLGKAADWTPTQTNDLYTWVATLAPELSPITANLFGVNHWNPGSEDPAWVWAVGDTENGLNLEDAHRTAWHALRTMTDRPDIPEPHSPWVAHVTGAYSTDTWPLEEMTARIGPVTFDRIRVAFAGETVDIPLTPQEGDATMPEPMPEPPAVTWSTPDGTALAFENQQTGDGRVFTPGALHWDGDGPWPLKLGHDAETELAGAIHGMGRDGDRIAAHGVLYPATDAGWEAATLLAQGAPLGVSVDLDDVDYEVLISEDSVAYKGRLVTASVLPLADGYIVKGQTADEVHASADYLAATSVSRTVTFRVDADGLVAAAGDGAWTEGAVVDEQKSGDLLMRITRARIRGASLVTIPAFAGARIVLDDPGLFADGHTEEAVSAAIKSTTDYDRVLRHVRRSNAPVGAARLAQFLKLPLAAAQRLLALAASRGEVVRLTRGLYTDKTTSARADHVMMDDMVASVTGSVDLPVAPRDTEWDGDAALRRMVEAGVAERGCAYQEDGTDGTAAAHFKLPYADVIDGTLAASTSPQTNETPSGHGWKR
jgi:2'-5' RNA ligase